MSTPGGSKEALQAALQAARDAGNPAEEARILREIAAIERADGHDWRARRNLEKALEIYRETSDLRGVTDVISELEPVAEAEGTEPEDADAEGAEREAPVPGGGTTAPAGAASDIITMGPVEPPPGEPRWSPPAAGEGGRLTPSPPPGGSRREGTSWPVALGFLLLIAAVAGGLIFLGIRVVGELLGGDGGDPEPDLSPHAATIQPSPSRTRLPANNGERGEPLTAKPTKCDVQSSDVFAEVTMRVSLVARDDYQLVVLRGTLTKRGEELGQGIQPVTPVDEGTHRVEVSFTVFEDVPRGRLTCGVKIETAVPAF